MEKRIFTAVVLSIGFLWLWAALAPRLFPDLVRQKPPATAQKTTPPAPTTAPTETGATSTATSTAAVKPQASTPAPRAASIAPSQPATPVSSAKEELVVVDKSPEYIATFRNRGGQLISFKLLQYREKDGTPVELVKSRDPKRADFPFAIESANPEIEQRLNTALYVPRRTEVDGGMTTLEFRYADAAGVSATKTFYLGHEYLFRFNVVVAPAVPYRVVVGPGIRTLAAKDRDSQFIITGNGVVERDGKLKVIGREKGDRFNVFPDATYVGVEDNYFLVALKAERAAGGILRRAEFVNGGNEKRKDLYAGLNGSGGVVTGSAFFGPKQTNILERYGLAGTLQFGMFGFIARVFLDVLLWINKATHNFGWSIVVLTILIKIVLYPLQHKSMMSMKKMQRVQPKMEAIKAKYKKARTDAEQRQKMNVEMMQLYQKEGINPMGGCLPLLIQFPIFVGFYNLLSRAIELRGAEFIFWIRDLSEKDPYYITPILMTITMFIQTWMTPATGDPMQRRIFLIMPLVFGWIFKEFPSGLVVYWLVQNILTIIQQAIMNKYWKEHPEPPASS